METKQKYLRDIRDAINGVETAMPGVAGESEATYLHDIAKAIRASGIGPSIPKVTDADNGKILKVANGVWAKAEEEGVLYGEETPASSLGKDGDVYVQYETRSEEEALIENQQILDTDYITDILAEDYEILTFYVYRYVRDTKTEYDHYMVNVAMSYLMEYNHVEILDSDDHVVANITITNDGYIKIINNSSIQEYYLVFSIYEPVVKPNSITDIYLKVNGEWVKDRFSDLDVNNVAQILKSDSKNYRVLLSNDATDNAEDAEANKSDKLMFNPKNGGLILGRLTLKEGENSVRGKIYLYYKDSANSITCLIDPYSGIMTDSENFDIDLSNSTWDGTNASLKAAILAAKNQYVEVSGVLMPGETTITLTNAAITTDSTIDIYTSIYGEEPTNVVVANGSITLTFDALENSMSVKVRVS